VINGSHILSVYNSTMKFRSSLWQSLVSYFSSVVVFLYHFHSTLVLHVTKGFYTLLANIKLFCWLVACSCRSRVSRSAGTEARLDTVPRWQRPPSRQRHVQCRLPVQRQRRRRPLVSNRHMHRLFLGRSYSRMFPLVTITCTIWAYFIIVVYFLDPVFLCLIYDNKITKKHL